MSLLTTLTIPQSSGSSTTAADLPALWLARTSALSLKDYATTTWSNIQNGTADATATIQAALDAVNTANTAERAASRRDKYYLNMEPGYYNVGSGNVGITGSYSPYIINSSSDVYLIQNGKTSGWLMDFGGSVGTAVAFGTNTNDATTGQGAVVRGARSIVLSTSAHGLVVGDVVKVYETGAAGQIGLNTNLQWGDGNMVTSVSGATIGLRLPLSRGYSDAASFVQKINYLTPWMENLTFINPNQRTTTTGALRIKQAAFFTLHGLYQEGIDNIGINMRDASFGDVHVYAKDAESDPANGRNPYAFHLDDASTCNKIIAHGRHIRTTCTTNNSGGASAAFGHPTWNDITGSAFYNDASGFSTHTPGSDNHFHDIQVVGNEVIAMFNEAPYSTWERITVRGSGFGALVTDLAHHTTIKNCDVEIYRYDYLDRGSAYPGTQTYDGGVFCKIQRDDTNYGAQPALSDIKILDNEFRVPGAFIQLSNTAIKVSRVTATGNQGTYGLANRSGLRAGIVATSSIGGDSWKLRRNTFRLVAAEQLIGDGLTVSTHQHPATTTGGGQLIQGITSASSSWDVDENDFDTAATTVTSALVAATTVVPALWIGPNNSIRGVEAPYIYTQAVSTTATVDARITWLQELTLTASTACTLTLTAGTAGGQRLTVRFVQPGTTGGATVAKPANVSGTWTALTAAINSVDEKDLQWNERQSKWTTVAERANI
jgi:hypothetical protein